MQNVADVQNEGLVKLLGKTVTLYCASYIYTGILEGVNSTTALLSKAAIVYDTGSSADKEWKLIEYFPGDGEWYVQLSAIESFGLYK
jgi:hypothetical protein